MIGVVFVMYLCDNDISIQETVSKTGRNEQGTGDFTFGGIGGFVR